MSEYVAARASSARGGRGAVTVGAYAARRAPRPQASEPGRSEPAGRDDPVEELPCPGLVRLTEDHVRRALLEDRAAVEEADPSRDLPSEAHLLGRADHRHARRGQLAADLLDV